MVPESVEVALSHDPCAIQKLEEISARLQGVSVVGYVPYCIADPDNADQTLKAFKMLHSDGTFGDRLLLTDIDPEAVDCC